MLCMQKKKEKDNTKIIFTISNSLPWPYLVRLRPNAKISPGTNGSKPETSPSQCRKWLETGLESYSTVHLLFSSLLFVLDLSKSPWHFFNVCVCYLKKNGIVIAVYLNKIISFYLHLHERSVFSVFGFVKAIVPLTLNSSAHIKIT